MTASEISIFLLVRSLDAGGAERQLVELARGLHQRGHQVSVATFYKTGPLLGELERAGISVIDLAKTGRWDVFGFLHRTRKAIRVGRPDAIYSFLGGANIVAAVVRPFLPPTTMIWSIRASDMDLERYDWLHRASYALESRLSFAPDLIIANSNAGRDFAVDHGFPKQRIEVVPNGIDTDRFRPELALRVSQRAQWGIGDGEIAVGVLARLDPMKGYPTFLRAAAMLADGPPGIRFLCIGCGPEEAALKRLAAELGLADRVLFTGLATDPVAALNALDIYCSPSTFGEGFSNSVAEAMACGLPCVVTDVGDSARIVGDTGRIVPRSDPGALAEALAGAIAALGADRGAQARARIVENFSIDLMVDRTLKLLIKADDHLSA